METYRFPMPKKIGMSVIGANNRMFLQNVLGQKIHQRRPDMYAAGTLILYDNAKLLIALPVGNILEKYG
jgi:hypothetical protein